MALKLVYLMINLENPPHFRAYWLARDVDEKNYGIVISNRTYSLNAGWNGLAP